MRGTVALEMVAHDRPYHDRSTTGGEALKKTCRDEDADARACGAGERRQRIDSKATDQHAAPPKSIGQGADDNIPPRHSRRDRGSA